MSSAQSDIFTTDLGLRDSVADGLFNHQTGELRPGFVIEPTDIVLDVGCGQGIDALFCAERGASLIYVDIDPEAIAQTTGRVAGGGARELKAIVSDCNPLPLPDGAATKIVAAEVLEHVDDPGQILRELVRVGAPGARYMLAVPDPAAEEIQIGVAAPQHFQKPNHVRIIGRNEFTRLVTEAGLVIERRGFYGFYWSIWSMLFWPSNVAFMKSHPLLESWKQTWATLLEMPNSKSARDALNKVLPKSQYIVARKPAPEGNRLQAARGALRSLRMLLAGAPIAPSEPKKAERAAVPVDHGLAEPTAAIPVEDTIDPKLVGVHDAVGSGWFKFDKDELFEGFRITPDDIVLDVGCGEGVYAATCARMGAQIIAVDVNPESVAETARRVAEVGSGACKTIVSDCNPLPLDDGSVTKVIALEVLEYADDPLAMLQELKRVGQPGARYLLAVSDPVQEEVLRQVAPAELFTKPNDGGYSIRGLPRGHLHTIGRDEFERMVTAAGLVVERVHHVGFYWSLWFVFFWLCNVDFADPRHPLLAQWARTWTMLLDLPDGHKTKQRLDTFLPKRQIVVAWKP
jgi:ubiquinone/menaquinone biosynthesis C-methylase UbiE